MLNSAISFKKLLRSGPASPWKIFFVCLVFAAMCMSTGVQGQSNITTISYSMGLGTGNTGDLVSKYSWRGFGFDYRHFTTENVAVGVNLGWNTFYEEEPYGTYVFETVSATGYQYRYFNSFPMIAVADYFFKPGETVNPYAGLGLGVQYNLASIDFGIYRFESDGWPFTINPEIGVLIHPQNGPAFNVGIKFMYGFKTADLGADSHFLFNVGFAFGE